MEHLLSKEMKIHQMAYLFLIATQQLQLRIHFQRKHSANGNSLLVSFYLK